MNYKCERCGYKCVQKNDLRKHFNRKKLCKVILEDINIETLKLRLEAKSEILNQFESYSNPKKSSESNSNQSEINSESKYKCSYCKKSYSTNSNMCKHMKNCKEKVKNDKIAILEAEMAQKEAEMAQKEAEFEAEMALVKEQKEAEMALVKQEMELLKTHTKEEMENHKEYLMNYIEILMKKAGNTTNNIDNSITNNIDNKQINIHINGFGKEDLSYITDRHFRNWFNGPFSAIPNLVEYIHFNPKKPQNWNAKIQDDKTSKALIYNAEKEMWVKREKKQVINDMVEKSYNMLDTNFELQKEARTLDQKGKKKFENFMKIYDKGSKELDKRYETEIREKLLNFKEYHINK